VLQPSPLKKSRPKITKEEGSSENEDWSLNHFIGLNGRKVGIITFLIPGQNQAYYRVRTCDENEL
jgi:hypothetical protein